MKARSYSTATAFRRALEDRLARVARDEHVDLQRIRRQVAFDRLLARLFAEGNPPWILKGAYALELKLHTARTTKDIDLGLAIPPSSKDESLLAETLLEILQTAAAHDLGDFFVFLIGEPMMDLDAARAHSAGRGVAGKPLPKAATATTVRRGRNNCHRSVRTNTKERFIPQQATYTAKEAAAYLNVSERQIRYFIARKLLRKSKAQAKTLIPGEDVETLLARTS